MGVVDVYCISVVIAKSDLVQPKYSHSELITCQFSA